MSLRALWRTAHAACNLRHACSFNTRNMRRAIAAFFMLGAVDVCEHARELSCACMHPSQTFQRTTMHAACRMPLVIAACSMIRCVSFACDCYVHHTSSSSMTRAVVIALWHNPCILVQAMQQVVCCAYPIEGSAWRTNTRSGACRHCVVHKWKVKCALQQEQQQECARVALACEC